MGWRTRGRARSAPLATLLCVCVCVCGIADALDCFVNLLVQPLFIIFIINSLVCVLFNMLCLVYFLPIILLCVGHSDLSLWFPSFLFGGERERVALTFKIHQIFKRFNDFQLA